MCIRDRLLCVTEECSVYEFGKKHFQNFQPQEGFGYLKVTDKEMEDIQHHKRVILIDEVCPV